ncbi:post-GPI attachment to proteins factor 2-like isoform X1 [Dermacentor andersoni]|uniref:post-GPI attachment to proteins factor 2-like isoform X1 n=1 Tax=Dermacentor andersoni TaxID=34620 RepID=UPI002415DF3E|nr:post-GPI attachment to proteins factor 2-like isoform X1 [Dermacentor andersoni]
MDAVGIPMDDVMLRFRMHTIVYLSFGLRFFGLLLSFAAPILLWGATASTNSCVVYDLLPSVDLVTGVAPQRHVWSLALLLDLNPRLVLAFLHWHYLGRRSVLVAAPERSLFALVTHAGLALHVAETLSLSLVSGLRNYQEYPAHERIYTHFVVSSLMFMLSACLSLRMCQHEQGHKARRSLRLKLCLVTLAGAVAAAMLVYVNEHRANCSGKTAESWFPVCQWVYAMCHVAFHLTFVYDIPNREVIVGTTRRRALRRDSRHG